MKRIAFSLTLVLLLALLATGCGSADPPAGDAGATDAGGADAARSDSGVPDDSGSDASATDSGGGETDAGTGDGGTADASGGTDAGSADAGTDAGPATLGSFALSYLGGAGSHVVDDQARDIAVDAAGNLYIAGGLYNYGGTFFTGAANRRTISGTTRAGEDIFVVKVTPDGALVYATLMGGPGYDRPYGIEVDAAGNATIAGRGGNGFPTTTGVVQPTFAGDDNVNPAYGSQDGLVARLAADGSLTWATYLGDGGPAFIRDVAIDAAGNAYVGVTLVDASFAYATAGSFAPVGASGAHAALVKLNATGTGVVWAGHLGGPSLTSRSGDRPTVRFAAGDVFVAYTTLDTAEPVTATAFQRTHAGMVDVVVARIRGDGTGVVYLTYFGGAGTEGVETHQMEVDALGRAHLAVQSNSARADAIVPVGARQRTNAGLDDVLVARLSADGSRVEAATFVGGAADDNGEGIAIDPRNGNIVFTGLTHSSDFPTTATMLSTGAFGDAIIVVLDAALDATSLIYSTRVGGAGNDDQLRSVVVDATGALAAAGNTNSMTLPTMNAVQMTYGGGPHDAWWIRLPSYP